MDGFKRDSRRPSQYAALLDEKTKEITLDDIKKEMLVREMPPEIQRMLQERIENLSFTDAARAADAYFDQDGKPRQASRPTTINAVHETTSNPTFPNLDDAEEVNAINRRFSNQRHGSNPNNNQRGGRTTMQWRRQPRSFSNQTTTARPQPQQKPATKSSNPILCYYHNLHGNRARQCEVSCPLYDEKRFPGNGRAGR